MSNISLNRIYTVRDCVLLQESLRRQQAGLIVKTGALQRRIERHQAIIEKTAANLIVKQAQLEVYIRALANAPATDVRIVLKHDLVKSQVLVLQARLLRYSPIRLIEMENKLQQTKNAVEVIDGNLQELSAFRAQLMEQTVSTTGSPLPTQPTEPGLAAFAPVQTEPAVAMPAEKSFLPPAASKPSPLPELEMGAFQTGDTNATGAGSVAPVLLQYQESEAGIPAPGLCNSRKYLIIN